MAGMTVTADAQFGIPRLLRPFETYSSVYQGQAAATPILFSEVLDVASGTAVGWGSPLDPLAQAGTVGYDQSLVRGLSTPIGSRVLLWLPKFVAVSGPSSDRYAWLLKWRMRNLNDHNLTSQAYHIPITSFGVRDTTVGTGGERFIIPAASQTIMYSQSPAPVTTAGIATGALRQEDFTTGAGNQPLPLIPGGGTGAIQQGIINPNSTFGTVGALNDFFQLHEVQALGDELVIGCYRGTTLGANWDFAGADVNFSAAVAYSQVGIWALVGTAP